MFVPSDVYEVENSSLPALPNIDIVAYWGQTNPVAAVTALLTHIGETFDNYSRGASVPPVCAVSGAPRLEAAQEARHLIQASNSSSNSSPVIAPFAISN